MPNETLPRLCRYFVVILLCMALPRSHMPASRAEDTKPARLKKRIILFVWDGLRPDSISKLDTPNLVAIAKQGTIFNDHHSTYPTFTMVNAASLATGGFPGKTGFYGNTLYEPGPGDFDSEGTPRRQGDGSPLLFSQPIFTEDYSVLKQLNEYYLRQGSLQGLLLVETLFQAAHRKHLKTAAVGKSGPAFLQDIWQGSVAFLDERMVWPSSFVKEMQMEGDLLPYFTPLAYCRSPVDTSPQRSNPTKADDPVYLKGSNTSDSSIASASPWVATNSYIMGEYLARILPKDPDLSVIWLRNPDSTEHTYGPGSMSNHAALKAQDELLGKLLDRLQEAKEEDSTDLLVVSDHGHSSVSGPTSVFPLRAIRDGNTAQIDANGFSVSGEIRTAQFLSEQGFTAYDGVGCIYDPVLSGIRKDGSSLYKSKTDQGGSACPENPGMPYTTANYEVPKAGPKKGSIVIASNGGSEYIYIPDHDRATATKIVRFMQAHDVYGAIFVDDRYASSIPGVLGLSTIHAQNSVGRNPDIIVSLNFNETEVVNGLRGIEYSGMQRQPNRGMHGAFSPVDVSGTLIAKGPHFRRGFVDTLPTGNVDVAPTIARILGFSLPEAEGRILTEALAGEPAGLTKYSVTTRKVSPPKPSMGLRISKYGLESVALSGPATGTYTVLLRTKTIKFENKTYAYFDWARAIRGSTRWLPGKQQGQRH